MMIRSFDVMSVAKMQALLGIVFGFLIGGVFSLISILGMAAGGGRAGLQSILFGVGAVIVVPIFYGTVGFVFGALVYNLLASVVGGVVIHVDQPPLEE